MATDLNDNINTEAQKPKKVTVDGVVVESHDLKSQIEADRYAKSNAAAASAKRGFSIAKMSPPGTA